MRGPQPLLCLIALTVLAAGASPALAQRTSQMSQEERTRRGAEFLAAIASEWDSEAPVLLRGSVVAYSSAGERRRIRVTVSEAGKPDQDWLVDLIPQSMMDMSVDWNDLLTPGKQIIIRGYQAREKSCSPECRAVAHDVTFPDGTRIFSG